MGYRQDEALGYSKTRVQGKSMTAYDPPAAMEICRRVASGELLKDICTKANGLPAVGTFQKWCAVYPDVNRAWQAARQLSAQAFEEINLGLAGKLVAEGSTPTAVDIRATEVAMGQYRWSAARRDPAQYGEKAPVNMIVPVHITTSLNMGEVSNESTTEHPDIYTIAGGEPEIVVPADEVKVLSPPSPSGQTSGQGSESEKESGHGAREVPEALRNAAFLPPAERKPFSPFVVPKPEGPTHRKRVLVPRIAMDAETPLREKQKRYPHANVSTPEHNGN